MDLNVTRLACRMCCYVVSLVVFDLQLVRECKEVLKGGLLMKQYYQFMLRGVVTDAQGLQTNANIDEFEEDLHKMLVVRPPTLTPSSTLAPPLIHGYLSD